MDSTVRLRFSEIKTPKTTVFPDEDRTEGAAERPGGSQVTTVGHGKEVTAPLNLLHQVLPATNLPNLMNRDDEILLRMFSFTLS